MAGRGKIIKPALRMSDDLQASPHTILNALRSLKFDDNDGIKLGKCVDMYESLISSNENPGNLVTLIHSTCLTESSLCRKAANFLAALERTPINDSHAFRTGLLTCLQEDFQAKEKLAKTNSDQLFNAVLLHGEIYDQLRILDDPLQVLAQPLIQYLTLVLGFETEVAAQLILIQCCTGSKHSMSILFSFCVDYTMGYTMAVNGENLKMQSGKTYDTLLVELRKTLMGSQVLFGVKLRLLLALELVSGSFSFDDGPSKTYYSEALGSGFRAVESRLFGTPFDDDALITKFNSTVQLSSASTAVKNPVGLIPDVEAVRLRMRAKGLLPRKSVDVRLDKEGEVYGIQVPKSPKGDAYNSPLPAEDW